MKKLEKKVRKRLLNFIYRNNLKSKYCTTSEFKKAINNCDIPISYIYDNTLSKSKKWDAICLFILDKYTRLQNTYSLNRVDWIYNDDNIHEDPIQTLLDNGETLTIGEFKQYVNNKRISDTMLSIKINKL